MSFYSYEAINMKKETIRMDLFRDKVVLVVNTASKCGFTPQFKELEDLYRKYQNSGFVILGFPCNQFGQQDAGTNEEILDFCQINYGVTFPMFEKIEVNGDNAHELFKYLKKELPGLLGSKIKWNFTKFLIDDQGQPNKRFGSMTGAKKIEAQILKLLPDKPFQSNSGSSS
jgi:glutathione peroxidase